MTKRQKLELTWIGKENRPRLEPRILLEDHEKSYHAKFRVKEGGITRRRGDAEEGKGQDSSTSSLRASASPRENDPGDIFDNMLIHGDNLLALKALEQEFADKLEAKLEEFVLNNASRVVRTARVSPSDVNEDAREALMKSMEKSGEVFRSESEDKADYYFLNGEQLLLWGNWVVSQEYNAPMLAEAVCKLEGFSFAPSDTLYWQHGHSTERDFLYVTTASLNHDQLQQLSDEVGLDRTLLVVCSAFRGRKEGYPNLTVKKIPKAVLTRCEWGHDDYSLNVENLPKTPPKPGQQDLF